MGRAGRSGGGGSSSRGGSNFSGGWSSSGRSSSKSSSARKSISTSTSTTKRASTSKSNITGGWSSSKPSRTTTTNINRNNQKSSSVTRETNDDHNDHHNHHHHHVIYNTHRVANNTNVFGTNQNSNKKSGVVNNTSTQKGNSGGCGCGCLLMILAFIVAVVFSSASGGISSDGSIESTIERTPMDSSKIVETDYYYYDNLDWIKSPTVLEGGMKIFYEKTGVQPFLIITDNINGNYRPTNAEAKAFMVEVYDLTFEDQGHMMVLFLEAEDDHATWIYCGTDAAKVVDAEARDILYSNIEHEYYSDKSDELMFSTAFSDTAEQIMTVHKVYGDQLIIALILIFVGVMIYNVVSSKRKKKTDEQPSVAPIIQTTADSTIVESKAEEAAKEPTKEPTKERVVECTGCGAMNKVKDGSVSECEYCGVPLS